MADNEPTIPPTDATAACCASFYEQDIVQELLGGSYHPGGEDLSTTLGRTLGLAAGQSVLDVACGVGTTSRLLAQHLGLNATGLDFSQINIDKAQQLSAAEQPASEGSLPISGSQPCCAPGEPCCEPDSAATESGPSIPSGKLDFVRGSADDLPFEDAHFDGLVCECAVSTFSDQPKAAGEFYRVLKPGAVFGMTDMVITGKLPDEFAEKVAPWTCMAKALDAAGYSQLFSDAGFELIEDQDHSHTLLQMATDIKRKLVMAGVGKALGAIGSLGMNLTEMRAMLAESSELVRAGTVQYRLLMFRK